MLMISSNNELICLFLFLTCIQFNNCFSPQKNLWKTKGALTVIPQYDTLLAQDIEQKSPCIDNLKLSTESDILIVTSSNANSYFTTKPFGNNVTWSSAFSKVADKMIWEGRNDKYSPIAEGLKVEVVTIEDLAKTNIPLLSADSIVFVGLDNDFGLRLSELTASAKVVTTFNCSPSISQIEKFGDYLPSVHGPFDSIFQKFDEIFKTKRLTDRKRYELATDLWSRRSLDDLVFLMFILVDSYGKHPIKSVKSVTSTETTGFKQLSCMCSNCAKEMVNCFKDETCRKALDCLNKCRGNDQVCSYRCITSHETPAFEKFALCILQKHNCMGNSATIPVYPDPAPLPVFRGRPLTFEDAENIFIGHLKLREGEFNPLAVNAITDSTGSNSSIELLPWSWKVVCGQNPAYDYFACQHQLFYRDKKRPEVVWYDPVFRVTTLYGEEVWRRRHYRVRRAASPGQFYFSVVDNGVVSKEYWRILDCADDLSWAVFYYGGAAAAAGTSYTGALVVTPDGKWPEMTEEVASRIEAALKKAEITMWELFEVHNDCCDSPSNPPPLGLPN